MTGVSLPGRPTVEIAVHADGRYRLIVLTAEQARGLATLLARCADMLGMAGCTPPV
jgi:hypothetical protein